MRTGGDMRFSQKHLVRHYYCLCINIWCHRVINYPLNYKNMYSVTLHFNKVYLVHSVNVLVSCLHVSLLAFGIFLQAALFLLHVLASIYPVDNHVKPWRGLVNGHWHACSMLANKSANFASLVLAFHITGFM